MFEATILNYLSRMQMCSSWQKMSTINDISYEFSVEITTRQRQRCLHNSNAPQVSWEMMKQWCSSGQKTWSWNDSKSKCNYYLSLFTQFRKMLHRHVSNTSIVSSYTKLPLFWPCTICSICLHMRYFSNMSYLRTGWIILVIPVLNSE